MKPNILLIKGLTVTYFGLNCYYYYLVCEANDKMYKEIKAIVDKTQSYNIEKTYGSNSK
jgi:hypothetical protein